MGNLNQSLTTIATFNQTDFDRFALLSGDDNPIHVNAEYAAKTKFGRPVAHGMFLYSHICAALNQWLPEMVQVEQEMMFPGPIFTDEDVDIMLNVKQLLQNGAMEIETTISRPDGSLGLTGTATVFPRQFTPQGKQFSGRSVKKLVQSQPFAHLEVGQSAQTTRRFTQDDIAEFVALTCNENPRFSQERQNIPNGLLAGMFSDLLGTKVPGRGTNWLKQRLIFPQPAYVDDQITAVVTISRIRPEKALVNLETTCTTAAGDVVCWGEALVWVNELEKS